MKYDICALTPEEKLHLLTGKDKWSTYEANGKLPSVFMSDGPHGLRTMGEDGHTKKATAMPNLSAVANSWDEELAYLDGSTIADDCIESNVDILLAPGVNIKRTPLCGRNFEYFSEDPYHAGILAKAFVKGVQDKGVGTSVKHFFANNREIDRLWQSNELDERTAYEIYLPAFEHTMEAKPWTVMCSYNPINGVWAAENKWALNDVLRERLGFDGVVVSDWGAVRSGWRSVKATLDIRMPYAEKAYDDLKAAYDKGLLSEQEINARAEKILALIEKAQAAQKKVSTTKEQRHENAVRIATDSIVLLKNEDNILPLQEGKILVKNAFEKAPAFGGGGSALAKPEYEPRPLQEELAERAPHAKFFDSKAYFTVDRNDHYADRLTDLYKAAYHADKVVLCVGTGKTVESEGFDRESIRLSALQEDVILRLAKINKNLIVVLFAGSAVDVSPWADRVKGILLAGFLGEGVHEALANVLTGTVSPSGKLCETFPLSLEDTPTGSYTGNGLTERYDEGIFVGYRWYDRYGMDVQYPFGYGLSYADFAYSDLEVKQLGDTDFEVSLTVRNTGSMAAKEVVQLYVRDPFAMVARPEKELKGFKKIALEAGESKRVTLTLNKRSFAYYSTVYHDWHVENGDFEILVGASSRDIRLSQRIQITLPEETQHSLSH